MKTVNYMKYFSYFILVAALLSACGPTGNFAVGFSDSSFRYHGNIPFDDEGSPRFLYPSLGAPYFARPGDQLKLRVVWPAGREFVLDDTVELSINRSITNADGNRESISYNLLPIDVRQSRARNIHQIDIIAETGEEIPSGCYNITIASGNSSMSTPLSLRIFRGDLENFRFLHITDIQLQDPRFEEEKYAKVMKMANSADALFALVTGDMVFGGSDYRTEYDQFVEDWTARADFCSFFLPGNHDHYYQMQKRSTVESVLAKAKSVLGIFSKPLSFLGELFMGSDIKENVDGQEIYLEKVGPLNYTADFGDLRLIILNTYGGDPGRRTSVPPSMVQQYIKKLRVPPVDNWGGQLSAEDLNWLEQQLKLAEADKKRVIVAGHHDPRGTRQPSGDFIYIADDPFNTRPFDLEPFESWNYNPKTETPENNSGVETTRLLCKYAECYIAGHTHNSDEDLLQALGIERKVPIISTVSAGPTPVKGTQGLRLFRFGEQETTATKTYHAGVIGFTADGKPTAVGDLGSGFPYRVESLVDNKLCIGDENDFSNDTGKFEGQAESYNLIGENRCLRIDIGETLFEQR
jgi:predicted MPP superfamily phosphohydrolase